MTNRPTLIEFKETVRDAFGYLGGEFAFRAVQSRANDLEVNPFIVRFVNATTLVQVEGINWGFAAQVILGPADAGGEWHATVPLWAIIKHRRPDLYEESVRSLGQLDDIRYCAHVLRETASDVLRGDFGVFTSARAIVEGEGLQQRIGDDAAMRDRNHRAAVTAAADAFRVRDFGLVVQLLTPQIEFLTPAERARLDYARARVGRQDGAV